MTVSATTPIASATYSGAGDYTYTFTCYDEEDLTVVHLGPDGLSTILTLTTDYTVVLESDFVGGTVTVTNGVITGGRLEIRRILEFVQEYAWVNNNALPAAIIERSFDRTIMLLQQMNTQLAGALQATEWKGAWETGVSYSLLNVAVYEESWYVVIDSHTSGVFATDLAEGKLRLLLDVSSITALHEDIEGWHTDIDAWQAQTALDVIATAADVTDAETARDLAEGYAAAALAAAAAVDLPVPETGDEGKALIVADPYTDGYELGSVEAESPLGNPASDGMVLSSTAAGVRSWVDSWSAGIPTGTILLWMTATAPEGTLECNGAAISRTTYSSLFDVIGTTYGVGNGSTTFNVPDLRGEFPRGWAHGSTNDPDRTTRTNRGDGTTGDNIGTKQADGFKSHTHVFHDSGYDPGGSTYTEGSVTQNSPRQYTTSATGGNETRPRNVNVMFAIKY